MGGRYGCFCLTASTSDQYGVSRTSILGFLLASAATEAATPLPKDRPHITIGSVESFSVILSKTAFASSFKANSLIVPGILCHSLTGTDIHGPDIVPKLDQALDFPLAFIHVSFVAMQIED